MKTLIAAIIVSLALADKTEDNIWKPDPKIDSALLPVRLTDANWNEVVMDPETNQIRDGKQWFIFYYYRKCTICQKFKDQFELISKDLTQEIGVRFGMVDVMESELLKESFKVKVSPWIVFLKDGTAFDYDNLRNKESIKNFIQSDLSGHGAAASNKKLQFPIPPLLTWFGLQ
jgi:Thioredoxin